MYDVRKADAGRRGERRAGLLDCVIRLSITAGANGVMTGGEAAERCGATIVKDYLHFGGRSIFQA